LQVDPDGKLAFEVCHPFEVGRYRRIALVAINAERDELATLRDQDVVNDTTVRTLESRIDHAELIATEATRGGGHG
jgi:hypothetical protein